MRHLLDAPLGLFDLPLQLLSRLFLQARLNALQLLGHRELRHFYLVANRRLNPLINHFLVIGLSRPEISLHRLAELFKLPLVLIQAYGLILNLNQVCL